jgi:hypothetical protein
MHSFGQHPVKRYRQLIKEHMREKIKLLKDTCRKITLGTPLQIISLQGVYKCELMEKLLDSGSTEIDGIRVRTLENKNPDYEAGKLIDINLYDGGLSQIVVISKTP